MGEFSSRLGGWDVGSLHSGVCFNVRTHSCHIDCSFFSPLNQSSELLPVKLRKINSA